MVPGELGNSRGALAWTIERHPAAGRAPRHVSAALAQRPEGLGSPREDEPDLLDIVWRSPAVTGLVVEDLNSASLRVRKGSVRRGRGAAPPGAARPPIGAGAVVRHGSSVPTVEATGRGRRRPERPSTRRWRRCSEPAGRLPREVLKRAVLMPKRQRLDEVLLEARLTASDLPTRRTTDSISVGRAGWERDERPRASRIAGRSNVVGSRSRMSPRIIAWVVSIWLRRRRPADVGDGLDPA
jgi:hypothetical protein